jgi:ABC-type proline/glycine betaine transport system permease subunit
MAVQILQFLALLSCCMYTGASLYASLVEHPARMACGTEIAARVFAPSYSRAITMLFTLVLVATISSLGVWTYVNDTIWFVGSATIFAIIPFTILAVTPTLGELLRPELDPGSPRAALLLSRWGWLNTVRSLLGLSASCLFLYGTIL